MHGKPAATGVTYIAGAEVLVHADILVLVLGYRIATDMAVSLYHGVTLGQSASTELYYLLP